MFWDASLSNLIANGYTLIKLLIDIINYRSPNSLFFFIS